MTKIEITLDKEKYRPGDKVRARIELIVTKHTKINKFDARIFGIRSYIKGLSYRRSGAGPHSPHSVRELIFENRRRFIYDEELDECEKFFYLDAKLPNIDPIKMKKKGIDIFYHVEAYADIDWALDVRAEKKIEVSVD
ncbi:MAG: hypothetical protein AB1779_10660 [Candidatus Thermoplasmatota archaeon]